MTDDRRRYLEELLSGEAIVNTTQDESELAERLLKLLKHPALVRSDSHALPIALKEAANTITTLHTERDEAHAQGVVMMEALRRAQKELCNRCYNDVPMTDDTDGVDRGGRYHAIRDARFGNFNEMCKAWFIREALSSYKEHG